MTIFLGITKEKLEKYTVIKKQAAYYTVLILSVSKILIKTLMTFLQGVKIGMMREWRVLNLAIHNKYI